MMVVLTGGGGGASTTIVSDWLNRCGIFKDCIKKSILRVCGPQVSFLPSANWSDMST